MKNRANPVIASGRTRRRFVLDLGCAGLGTTTLFSSLAHLGAFSAASAQTLGAGTESDDYRALVCILLAGGNDSFNMLLPDSTDDYEVYRRTRGDLALERSSLLPLVGHGEAGPRLAVHPGMPEVQRLYDQGVLTFLSNVGTLVERITVADYGGGYGRLPLGLYSHADQIAQWQTALPDSRSATGWGGRLADSLSHLNHDDRVSMNISIAGTNVFQTGEETAEFSVGADGPVNISGYEGDSLYDQLRTTAIDSLMNERYRNVLEQVYADRFRGAIEGNRFFTEALAESEPPTTTFALSALSQSLRMVANTIAARQSLGHRRQTFFVIFGGWDHHDGTLPRQAMMLPVLSRALDELYRATLELGVERQVTTFTISDFGRTLTTNGKGSDHGWGGNQIVLGGAVRGGRIYGQYPSLSLGGSLDTGRGRMVPTLSTDEMFAELALWLGADPSALDLVLPNVERFYDPRSGAPPVGFLL